MALLKVSRSSGLAGFWRLFWCMSSDKQLNQFPEYRRRDSATELVLQQQHDHADFRVVPDGHGVYVDPTGPSGAIIQ